MAFFSDTPVNPNTGRHELHFVNQQYDYLFGIRWDEARQDYAADVGAAEARAIAGQWGDASFDLDEQLARARRELPLKDRSPTPR